MVRDFNAGESLVVTSRKTVVTSREKGHAYIPTVSSNSGENVVLLRARPGEKQSRAATIDGKRLAG